MEEANYRLEQIQSALRNYQHLCDIFLELAPNSETKEILEEILYQGRYNDFSFNSGLSSKDGPLYEGKRRVSMAYLLIRNPETFNFFAQNKINLFHGTNGSAMPTILKYGLNSLNESEKLGIPVVTGETWTRDEDGRGFVSLSDILGVSCGYSTLKPKEESNLCFELVVGVSFSKDSYIGLCHVASDVPEVGVRNNISLENIKAFCVPSDKLEFVKKIVSNTGIKVLPMDDAENRFYYVDDFNGIYFYPELLDKLKEDLKQKQKKSNFAFSLEDFKNMTINRVLASIKAKLESIGLISDEEERKL